MPRTRRRRKMCVANTHIFWDPEFADVKLWQTWVLCQELSKLVLSRDLPLLLCGDFNSVPNSAVYQLLNTQQIGSDDFEVTFFLFLQNHENQKKLHVYLSYENVS